MRPYRNHPSVVMWATNPNRFGVAGMDLDPRYMGRQRGIPDPGFQKAAVMVRKAISMIKQQDPTRPAFSYSGDVLGDVYSINCYLDFEPLQEREDWLSEWAKSGDMPLQCVEFGTPWSASFMRGRWGQSADTEPWMTEFCAIYLGPEAYTSEPDRYRGLIAQFVPRGPEVLELATGTPSGVRAGLPEGSDALHPQYLPEPGGLWGISGGMTPWDMGWGWDEYYNNLNTGYAHGRPWPALSEPLPAFKPGARGTFPQSGINENHDQALPAGGHGDLPRGLCHDGGGWADVGLYRRPGGRLHGEGSQLPGGANDPEASGAAQRHPHAPELHLTVGR